MGSPIIPRDLPQFDSLRPIVAGAQIQQNQRSLDLQARRIAQQDAQFAQQFGLEQEQFGLDEKRFGLAEDQFALNAETQRAQVQNQQAQQASLNQLRERNFAVEKFKIAMDLAASGNVDEGNAVLDTVRGQLQLPSTLKLSATQNMKDAQLFDNTEDGSIVAVDKETLRFARVAPAGTIKPKKADRPSRDSVIASALQKHANNESLSPGEQGLVDKHFGDPQVVAALAAARSDLRFIGMKPHEQAEIERNAIMRGLDAAKTLKEEKQRRRAEESQSGAARASVAPPPASTPSGETGETITRQELEELRQQGLIRFTDEQVKAQGIEIIE